ncbi:MAG TPA: phosphoribosylformylglycinamidine synthase I [Patescibacteria group bacterium]|nr:phosphoribosylformylglycinamidine synthase I [Patescibacteria group bacterium]
MKKVKVCVLRTAGTNCDQETAAAFKKADSDPELVHVNSLVSGQKDLAAYHILAIPGGFSYGDDIASGKVFANELRCKLFDQIKKFVQEGKAIIGICNGFQVLVKSGLLPGNPELKQEASLIINDSGKFEDRWAYLKASQSRCVWSKGLPEVIYLPVAHGEGKFVAKDKKTLEKLKQNGQVVLRYCTPKGEPDGYSWNPNGSVDNIAGICDESGRILGLMPHPERHVDITHHPRWTGQKTGKDGDGILIIRNGVEYARRNL